MTRPAVEVLSVGQEGEPVVVIDGFAPDPEALVRQAQAVDFATLGAFYPGVRAAVGADYCAAVGPLVAAALRNVFDCANQLAFDRALYSQSVTPPQALSLAQRIPHIDDTASDKFAIVHYLGPEALGGTRFFRHRATGFETITSTRHQAYLAALADDFRDHGEPPAGYIQGDTAIFSATTVVPARFNRAIIYRSNLLHCAAIPNDIALPADPATGRLTIASFLTAS